MGYLNKLFEAMERGGEFDLTDIAWFNGGLFDGRRALRLDDGDIALLVAADSLDWGLIDPTIFGTLFERFLDPEMLQQLATVAGIFHGDGIDRLENLEGAGYHVTQITDRCGYHVEDS